MQILKIQLKKFRNYEDLVLEFPPGIILFVGDNGQGKTNLIEAIHLALRGNSFRAGSADTFIKQSEECRSHFSVIKSRLVRSGLVHDLHWTSKEGIRRMEWNGRKTSGLLTAREFPIVLFSPESLAAIKEGPEQRRQLVDDLLLTHSASSVGVIKEFNKALKARNRILKDFKKSLNSEETTTRVLESLDPIFLPLGAELAWLRIESLKALEQDWVKAFTAVLKTSEPVEIQYLISGQIANDWDRSKILDAMHQRALELRKFERDSGQSLVGPQRHDIRFLFAGKDSRYFCSQGQQRALILSYKMAQIMYHHRTHQVYPFLLLDDVLSELDPDKRTNLVRFLKEIPSQIFLTTTDLSFSLDFGDRSLSVFRIDKGVIEGARDAESLQRRFNSSPRRT
jgi:DNA replication and repair protein RecF